MTSRRALYRISQLRELAALGYGRKRSAALIGITQPEASRLCRLGGIPKSYDPSGWGGVVAKSKKRAEAMFALYRDGYTLEQIGAQFGITRERVRQLMTKHFGVRREDGGQHVKAVRGAAERSADREARYLKKYGCSVDEWRELRRIGDEMLAAGKGLYQTPLYAWSAQRRNAMRRGIGWELNVWQWWAVWQHSGHWEGRGRGAGYVMCRKGDEGPYAIGNVFIATAARNSSDGQRKRRPRDLPMGVKRNRSGTFSAHRSIDGKTHRLGTFPTPDLAYAAYLMAAPQERQAA